MREASWIEVNLAAIEHNMKQFAQVVGEDCGLCPIIKADAYGLGATRLAKYLVHFGAKMLAVFSPAQAAELFSVDPGVPVLVLMPVHDLQRLDSLYRGLISGRLHLTVHDEHHLESLKQIAERFGTKIPVHLEIDTGMTRGGCRPQDAITIIERIRATRWCHLVGVFTHFANASADPELMRKQLKTFNEVLEQADSMLPPGTLVHTANTFAALRSRDTHQSLIRIGLGWAGYGPEIMTPGTKLSRQVKLKPALTWFSRIVKINTIEAGSTVGYGARWTATQRSHIGVIPVGYADGYPHNVFSADRDTRCAHIAVQVETDGTVTRHYAPVVGAVNMDQVTVDLTEIIDQFDDAVGVGTTVELITADAAAPNHLTRLAQLAGTIPHDMLTRLNSRIHRSYVRSTAAVEIKPMQKVPQSGERESSQLGS